MAKGLATLNINKHKRRSTEDDSEVIFNFSIWILCISVDVTEK